MDSNSSPKSASRLFSIIALSLFLVILPAGSWYYLQKGADYRKSLYDELLVKDDKVYSNFLSSHDLNNGILVKNRMKGFTTILVSEQSGNNPRFKQLISQFDKAYTFRVVNILSGKQDPLETQESINIEKTIYDQMFANKDFYIIDVESRLRNSYKSTEEDFKKMIEHIAILLPRAPEKDIKIKK